MYSDGSYPANLLILKILIHYNPPYHYIPHNGEEHW